MSVYSDAVQADSPTSYYRHGEPSGTTMVDVQAVNNGTYVNTPTLGAAGLLTGDPDTAVTFASASSQYGRCKSGRILSGQTNWTIEAWVKTTQVPPVNGVAIYCERATAGNDIVKMEVNDAGKLKLTYRDDAGTLNQITSTGAALNDGVRHLVQITKSGTTVELYQDGADVGGGTLTATNTFTNASVESRVASDIADVPGSNLDATVDEVALYSSALSLARALEHYTVGITGPVVVAPQIHVREKPPLRHSVSLTNPIGRHYRWGEDEPDPANVPAGLRYSDTMPGGHETADANLPRKPGLDYPDLERLTDWQVQGVGGQKCWGGRLERAPRTSGDEVSVSPSAVGWVAHLDDDKSAREVYVNRDLGGWETASRARRLALLDAAPAWMVFDGQVAQDLTIPAVLTTIENTFPNHAVAEAVHRGVAGVALGEIYYDFVATSGINPADANWVWTVAVADNDSLSGSVTAGDLSAGSTGSGYYAPPAGKRVAYVQLTYGAAGGAAGIAYEVQWRKLALYGTHGLTRRQIDGAEPGGLLASDVVRHAVQTFAPSLQIKPDSIQQSSFVIPHLVFPDPTTAGEIVRQASRFDLPDWGVWDDKEFVWHESGARGRTWRLRIGPSQLEETGPQVDRLWESVIVSYADVDGSTRTVGPTGAGADTESSDLKDLDPDNPANKLGITRRALLQMSTSTAAGATEVGRRFLEQSKLLDRSGKARVVGWAEDDRGVLHPFSAVRSGDFAVFVDANDTSARKIVRTEKDHDSRTCTLDLDAPPEGLQQLLERLGVVLIPLGLS